jgi:hypothetical protein
VEIQRFNKTELEKIAENFLSKYAAPGSGKYDGRCMRIEAVIESYGCTIFPIPGLAEIAEAYVPFKPGYIFADEGQYLSGSFRWRFTLAEELAHILIHRPLFQGQSAIQVKDLQEQITDDQYQYMEQNAKYLAGALLMRHDEFKAQFQHFYDLQSQRITNRLQILRYVIRQLSMDFHVSCYAAALRSLHVGLIDQPQLDTLLESFNW